MHLTRRKKILYGCLTAYVMVLALEILVAFVFAVKLPHYELIRRRMLGENVPIDRFNRCVGQPYLLFLPAPNYRNEYGRQHNEHGYRGKLVPMRRSPGVKRVVCMGGSTTYSIYVQRPEEAYPAQLESVLQGLKPASDEVEVLNAGVMWHSSAEILTHYLFKFRYYKPDLVIVNTGGNDGQAETGKFYSPDYSHWRKTMTKVQPLPRYSRWLMHSRIVSFLVISLFLHDYAVGMPHTRPEGDLQTIPWYPALESPAQGERRIPDDELAFYQNVKTLILAVKADGAEILLVAFRPNPTNQYTPRLRAAIERHERVLERLAREYNVPLARFPAAAISADNWMDDCHLNAPGCREKAAYLAPYVARILWPGAGPEPK